ncbi:endo-1,4-beta-xylanase [Streptomyces sp. B6B3]|uniref:endo-1,4-beta-xylanase n=1 Tax=Streptomyces sp. B6B3 TaxID=3153570 RepID=UPI00325CF948
MIDAAAGRADPDARHWNSTTACKTPSDEVRLARQAAEYRRVVEACVNVDGCRGVTVWGFSDADSRVPRFVLDEGAACRWDEGHRPKPAYHAMPAGFGAR